MGGGQRRPDRPFPVTCVLAAISPAAAISQLFGPTECAGPRLLPAKTNLVVLGERLNANSIVSANPDTADPTIARDLSGLRDDGDNFRIIGRHWCDAKSVTVFDPKRASTNDWRRLAVVL